MYQEDEKQISEKPVIKRGALNSYRKVRRFALLARHTVEREILRPPQADLRK